MSQRNPETACHTNREKLYKISEFSLYINTKFCQIYTKKHVLDLKTNNKPKYK